MAEVARDFLLPGIIGSAFLAALFFAWNELKEWQSFERSLRERDELLGCACYDCERGRDSEPLSPPRVSDELRAAYEERRVR